MVLAAVKALDLTPSETGAVAGAGGRMGVGSARIRNYATYVSGILRVTSDLAEFGLYNIIVILKKLFCPPRGKMVTNYTPTVNKRKLDKTQRTTIFRQPKQAA